eukprot:scaffold72127_cov19-Tisochrysis_lutea.AAC.2
MHACVCGHKPSVAVLARAGGKDLPDITLPQRIKLPPPLPQTTAAPAANGGSPSKWVAAAAAGTAAGSAPAAAAVAAGHPALMSTVHQLVGLDVQVRWGTACRLWEGREGFHSSVSADNGSLA